MKYINGENVRINDVVRVHIDCSMNDKTLALVTKIDNDFINCISVVNGLPLSLTVGQCELCYRNDAQSLYYWRRIIDTNIDNFIAKYKDIKYVRDNWFSDVFIKNNITAKTILNRAKYPVINDIQAQTYLEYIEPIVDIIIAYGDYEFCKKYCDSYINIHIDNILFKDLFAAIWNC